MVLYFLFVPRGSLFTGQGRNLSVLLHHLQNVGPSFKFAYDKLAKHSCIKAQSL